MFIRTNFIMVKYNGCDLLVIHIHILKKENCEYIEEEIDAKEDLFEQKGRIF